MVGVGQPGRHGLLDGFDAFGGIHQSRREFAARDLRELIHVVGVVGVGGTCCDKLVLDLAQIVAKKLRGVGGVLAVSLEVLEDFPERLPGLHGIHLGELLRHLLECVDSLPGVRLDDSEPAVVGPRAPLGIPVDCVQSGAEIFDAFDGAEEVGGEGFSVNAAEYGVDLGEAIADIRQGAVEFVASFDRGFIP